MKVLLVVLLVLIVVMFVLQRRTGDVSGDLLAEDEINDLAEEMEQSGQIDEPGE